MCKDKLRETIDQSIKNMVLLYNDVGKIMQVIEEKMSSEKFRALGDTGVMSGTSSSLNLPKLWLPRYMARIYYKEPKEQPIGQVSCLVGYNIHLVPDYTDFGRHSLPSGFRVPLVAVSLLKFDEPLNLKEVQRQRTEFWDMLFYAGWYPHDKYTDKDIPHCGTVQTKSFVSDTVTYFVDMLALCDEPTIEQLIVEPMKEMYGGNEQYVKNQSIGRVVF